MKKQNNYWKDMFIYKNDSSNAINALNAPLEQITISNDKPIDFPLNFADLSFEYYKSITQSKMLELSQDIIQFTNDNNQVYTNVYERIDENLLISLCSFDCYLFVLRYPKNNKIMGLMIATMYDTNLQHKFALTCYLCIHKRLRNKGLCMMLIRKALNVAYEDNIKCSYYLEETPFSDANIKLERWMRPINVTRALKNGYTFEMPNPKNKVKYSNAYSISSLDHDLLYSKIDNDIDLELAFNYIQSTTNLVTNNKKYLMWCPTKQELNDLSKSKSFDILIIKNKKTEVLGLFILHKKQIFIPNTLTNSNVVFICYNNCNTVNLNSMNKCFNVVVWYCKNKLQDIDVLYSFDCGSLNKEVLSSNKAVETGEMYIDFYNFDARSLNKNSFFNLLL